MPLALKIFLLSLTTGLGGGYVGFRVGFYLALRFLPESEMKEIYSGLIAVIAAAAMGVASAVTTGVLAGKRAKN